MIFLENYVGFMHCFYPHRGISIANRLMNYIFSDFVVVRKQREIIPLRVKDCFVKLLQTDK